MIDLLVQLPPLRKAHTIAKQHRQDLFLVGGTIRDLYLNGSPGKDFDFLVHDNARSIAHQFAESCGGTFFCLDGKRGIYRTVITGGDFLKTADFSLVCEGDLTRDLLNRDFTINSIALNMSEIFEHKTLTPIDPAGGLDDIKTRSIRLTSPTSFTHDPVRMLRAVRLSSICNATLLPQTESLIKDLKNLVAIATDEPLETETRQYSIDDAPGLANMIEEEYLKPQGDRLSLYVNDEPVSLSVFPEDIITNILTGMANSLKGVGKITSIKAFLKRKE